MGKKSKGFVVPTFANGADEAPQRKHILTEEERRKMALAIKTAPSMEVIESLEKDMAEGRIPKWVLELPEPMET
jgi:U2 small nuclear ribonucleoprotein A'